MKNLYRLIIIICLIIFCNHINSQINTQIQDSVISGQSYAKSSVDGNFNFFASEELLHITLSFDIQDFLKTKRHEEYYDAIITIKINENDSISQQIKLKSRGIMRLDYCSFPPIMLNFNGNKEQNKQIQSTGKLKLVTHCKMIPKYEDYILTEYLTYKLYNLVTPYSFKTRLTRITYIDINKPDNVFTAYGFLIEDKDEMAERNHAVIIDNRHLNQKYMNSMDMIRTAVFNYMIGNTDWSITGQHNIKILKSKEISSNEGIPVTYDFDYAGLVNTNYALPTEGLPIKYVTERYYKGICVPDEELQVIIDEFEMLHGKILGTVNDFEFITEKYKKYIVSYIDSFYKMFKNKKRLVSNLNYSCQSF